MHAIFQEDRQHIDEEYREAQVSLAESIQIGRATAEQISRQGEVLTRAETIADETEYMLQKSARILRGMTWSGWVANIFSSDVKSPAASAGQIEAVSTKNEQHDKVQENPISTGLCSMDAYNKESFPSQAVGAVQSVKNYHFNMLLLQQCKTPADEKTCLDVCRQLRTSAEKALRFLNSEAALDRRVEKTCKFLTTNMTQLDVMYKRYEASIFAASSRTSSSVVSSRSSSCIGQRGSSNSNNRADLFLSSDQSSEAPKEYSAINHQSSLIQTQLSAQDAHLESLIPGLEELKHLSHAIGTSIEEQNHTLDSLHGRTEDLTDKAKLVVRRSERMIQGKQFSGTRPVLQYEVTIQHLPSEQYLCVVEDGIGFVEYGMRDACRFILWKTGDGHLFGLQNSLTKQWLGQSLLGHVVCSSTSFGQREQWEIEDENLSETRLLCASANWGSGGWLEVQEQRGKKVCVIGGNPLEGKGRAAIWRITNVSQK